VYSSPLHTESGGVPGFNDATLVILGYNSTNRQLAITNARHPPPLWCRAADREWGWLLDTSDSTGETPEDLPVGMIPGTDYRQNSIAFLPPDKLVLYTDGTTDAENRSGEPLGRDRLRGWVQRLSGGTPAETGRALL
jgi:sigma-B regulation protein RsbU (phosphoserine phosphatase)